MSIQLLLEDADKWYKHYSWLNRSKRNELLKETFNYPLPEEFVKEIDIVDILITHLDYLETERQYAKMIELYDAITPQKQVFGNDFFYVDNYFIDYYLFKHDPDGVKKHLISFKEYPIKAIDSLTNVFNKLIFYNYTDIALDVAMKIYPEIFHAGELMPDTDHDYARFIYMEKIQEINQTLIIGGVIDKSEIKKYLNKYRFVIKDEIDIIESVLADDFSDYPDIVDFYISNDKFMFKILLLFLRYMYQEKNVSFPAAASIWFEAMDILINEDQTDDSEADFDEIFALDPELYRDEIYKRFDFLSINTASAVALAWGMSYVYDFLKKYNYISNNVHNSAMTEILSIKAEIIKARADELWKYNYLHQWVKPDSVEEKDFIKEKEDFEYTFSNIIKTVKEPYSSLKNVAKKVPIKVAKIGRNDPCPCGSGKKYKKCCELSEGRLFD